MDSKLLHIVETSDLLTQKEILAYTKKGGLSAKEIYIIELKITNNPVNQELIDAFKEHPNLFKDFDNTNLRSPLDDYSIEWLLSLTAIVIISSMSFFLLNTSPKVRIDTEPTITNSSTETTPQKFEKPQVVFQPSEKSLKSAPNTDISASNSNREASAISLLASRDINQLEVEEIIDPKLINKKRYPYTYLQNLKITDYRKIRFLEISEARGLSGISANSENLEHLSNFEKLKNDSVYYMDFLKETLRGFQNKKYQAIIPAWSQMLSAYPDDDNALFYRAISYYYLLEFENSIKDLLTALSNPMSNFDEEAEWYLALNYHHSKQKQNCKSSLEAIIKRNAFYSRQAQKFYNQYYLAE